MKIGLDVMGGDFAPKATIGGAILAQAELPSSVKIVLIGKKGLIEKELLMQGASSENFEIIDAQEIIEMAEHPTKAYSQKTNSSISLGFSSLKEGKIDSFASVGNTGAMLVGSMLTVKTITGVIRPCSISVLPKESGGVSLVLDVGTNVDCKPDVLYQYGMLGSLFAQHVYNIENPKVGLLNIGEEAEKGNLVSQSAHNLMTNSKHFNFIGNVEGRDLFSENVDVIVCDGFTGNVVLKEVEAFYTLIKKRNIDDTYFNRFNYELYGGSPVLGINSTVMIGHGISSPLAIKNLLLLSKKVVELKLSDKIKQSFS